MTAESPPPIDSSSDFPALRGKTLWVSAGLLGLFVFAMFADVLIAPGTRVLGSQHSDMFFQFFSWREFGFNELKHGHLALWNPHTFSGAPYFGGLQGALLYPTNLLLLVLPLPMAINWSIALNVWLLGVFMYLWAAYRGLRPSACFLAGGLIMFCGPHFTHVFAGHIVHMASMTWTPLIFLAIDRIFDLSPIDSASVKQGQSIALGGWSLTGMFAVAMQIFAGHPQYLFYTGVIALIYSALHFARAFFSPPEPRIRRLATAALALLGIYAGGVLLAAVQFLTAVQASHETVRSLPTPFHFAAMFGFPPENLITLINPYFFGDMIHQPYWGRCYLWEMSLFIGLAGLVLALYGAIYAGKKERRFCITLVALTFLLALGAHTPLFRVLYDWAPGFDRFRSISKFTFHSALFFVMLAAIGFHRIATTRRVEGRFLIGGLAGGALLLSAATFCRTPNSLWQNWINRMQSSHEFYLLSETVNHPQFADNARLFAAQALLVSGLIALAVTALLFLVSRWRPAQGLLFLATLLEVSIFAWQTRETFDSSAVANSEIRKFLAADPGDYRILNPMNPNGAISIGALDLWGYDQGVVRRYAEFMTWTQGGNPDQATQYVNFAGIDPLYAMLRLRYAFATGPTGLQVAEMETPPLPHFQLVRNYRVLRSRDAIFAAMHNQNFDPRREVILEREPFPRPSGSLLPNEIDKMIQIVRSTTDDFLIEANLPQPMILTMTDPWTPAWRAVAASGSAQTAYDLQPANYILRAVPLAAGHHRFRVEYAPRAFQIGKWVSLISLVCYSAAACALLRAHHRCRRRATLTAV